MRKSLFVYLLLLPFLLFLGQGCKPSPEELESKGERFLKEKNYTEAIKCFREAAEQGLAISQYNLGVLYQYGEGVEKDETRAVDWYRKAAEQGHAKAQYNLAICYGKALGVPENYAEFKKWLRRAAEQGHELAQRDWEKVLKVEAEEEK